MEIFKWVLLVIFCIGILGDFIHLIDGEYPRERKRVTPGMDASSLLIGMGLTIATYYFLF